MWFEPGTTSFGSSSSAHYAILVLLLRLRRQRVSMELHQAVRSSGTGDLSGVAAVVWETNGTMSVLSRSRADDLSGLGHLEERRPPGGVNARHYDDFTVGVPC